MNLATRKHGYDVNKKENIYKAVVLKLSTNSHYKIKLEWVKQQSS
jgi:hypothetical protein